MLIRLRLLLLSLGSGLTLLLVLCLGAQNLNDRYRLNLGVGRSAPFPPASLLASAWCSESSAVAVWLRCWRQRLIQTQTAESGLE